MTKGALSSGDDADYRTGIGAEGRGDLGGVQAAEATACPRADVDQPAARAQGTFDDFHRVGYPRNLCANGERNPGVLVIQAREGRLVIIGLKGLDRAAVARTLLG